MRTVASDAYIEASREAVWALLRVSSWGVEVDGEVGPDAKLVVRSNMGGGFTVRVTEFSPPHRLAWKGGLPLGLFKAVRRFVLTAEGDGTRLDLREEFSGPLLPVVSRRMPDLQRAFDQYVAALKARAEAG